MDIKDLPLAKNRPKGIEPTHVLHYLNKGLNDREIAEILKCSRETIKYHRNKLNFQKDEIEAYKKDRERFQQFLQARITSKQIDFITHEDSKIKNWNDMKAAQISKATELDKEVITVNQFGATNIQINVIDDKISTLKQRIQEQGIDINAIDANAVVKDLDSTE